MEHTLAKMVGHVDTNVLHKCPLVGPLYIKSNAVPFNKFLVVEQLIPSGRYILEASFYENRNDSQWIGKTRLYMEFSDLRIEQF